MPGRSTPNQEEPRASETGPGARAWTQRPGLGHGAGARGLGPRAGARGPSRGARAPGVFATPTGLKAAIRPGPRASGWPSNVREMLLAPNVGKMLLLMGDVIGP